MVQGDVAVEPSSGDLSLEVAVQRRSFLAPEAVIVGFIFAGSYILCVNTYLNGFIYGTFIFRYRHRALYLADACTELVLIPSFLLLRFGHRTQLFHQQRVQ